MEVPLLLIRDVWSLAALRLRICNLPPDSPVLETTLQRDIEEASKDWRAKRLLYCEHRLEQSLSDDDGDDCCSSDCGSASFIKPPIGLENVFLPPSGNFHHTRCYQDAIERIFEFAAATLNILSSLLRTRVTASERDGCPREVHFYKGLLLEDLDIFHNSLSLTRSLIRKSVEELSSKWCFRQARLQSLLPLYCALDQYKPMLALLVAVPAEEEEDDDLRQTAILVWENINAKVRDLQGLVEENLLILGKQVATLKPVWLDQSELDYDWAISNEFAVADAEMAFYATGPSYRLLLSYFHFCRAQGPMLTRQHEFDTQILVDIMERLVSLNVKTQSRVRRLADEIAVRRGRFRDGASAAIAAAELSLSQAEAWVGRAAIVGVHGLQWISQLTETPYDLCDETQMAACWADAGTNLRPEENFQRVFNRITALVFAIHKTLAIRAYKEIRDLNDRLPDRMRLRQRLLSKLHNRSSSLGKDQQERLLDEAAVAYSRWLPFLSGLSCLLEFISVPSFLGVPMFVDVEEGAVALAWLRQTRALCISTLRKILGSYSATRVPAGLLTAVSSASNFQFSKLNNELSHVRGSLMCRALARSLARKDHLFTRLAILPAPTVPPVPVLKRTLTRRMGSRPSLKESSLESLKVKLRAN